MKSIAAIILLVTTPLWLMPATALSQATTPASAIEAAIKARLNDPRFDYVVSVNQLPVGFPEKCDSLRVEPIGDGQTFGNCWVKTFAFSGNVVSFTATVNVYVHWYQDALVSTAAIARGEKLTSDMFTAQRREIVSQSDPLVTSLDEISGMEVNRSLPPGKALSYSMLKPEELIRRGEQVTILYQRGSVQITATGEAKQSGARGELIKVRNLNTNKVITAEVQDEESVRVSR